MGFDQVTEKYEACQQEIIDGREKVESLTNALQLVQQELAHTKTGRIIRMMMMMMMMIIMMMMMMMMITMNGHVPRIIDISLL